jgi:hypothetical protein
MAYGTYRKMSLEEAKRAVLTPPPSSGGPAMPVNPFLLAVGAAAAGVLLSNPAWVRRLGRQASRVLRSPMVKRALVTFAASALGAKKAVE